MSKVPPTIRQLFEKIGDPKLSRTCLAGLSFIVSQLNIAVAGKLPFRLVPVLDTLTPIGKITADTLRAPMLEYVYITVIQLFIMGKYDILNVVSKDRDLTAEQFVQQFTKDVDLYADICCITYVNFIKEFANKGLTEILNKELATRVPVEQMFLTLILQPAFNPAVINLAPSACGALFLLGIDFVQDRVNTHAVPHLKYEEIIPFYFKYYNDYFQPIIIDYFHRKSKDLLGLDLSEPSPVLPPTNDPLLIAVLNGSPAQPSPSETFTGVFMVPVWNELVGKTFELRTEDDGYGNQIVIIIKL